jgi:hypothetical protein
MSLSVRILLFLLVSQVSHGDPGDLFNSRDSAAIDAGAYARNQTKDFLEYGGWIYSQGNCFSYNFTTGGPESIPGEKLEKLKPAEGAVALWHSHPGTKGTAPDLPINFFSGEDGDKGIARSFGVPHFLNTPSLENKVFDPRDNSTKTLRQRRAKKCDSPKPAN